MSRGLLAALLLAAVVVAGRAALPVWLEGRINTTLAGLDGHTGEIDDVDLSLWRGAFRLEGLEIDRDEAGTRTPLLRVAAIDVALRWRWLLEGAFVGEIDLREPVFTVEAAPRRSGDEGVRAGGRIDWGALGELAPFNVNRLDVHDGRLRYADPHAEPPVDVSLREIRIEARNWTNQRGSDAARPARAEASARAFRSAEVRAKLEADPLAKAPDFRLTMAGRAIELTALNDFLRAYAGLDVAAGLLDLYLELDAAGGGYSGYAKPLVRELDVAGPDDGDDDWFQAAWETVAGGIAEVFENQPEDQQGAKIPIEGEFGQAEFDLFAGIESLLHNAFIEALPQGLEDLGR